MQFPGRIEAIFERGQSLPEESVREVPLLFISKPYYENSQYVYMLRQEFAQLDVHAQHSHSSHSSFHSAEPNALLLLGGLMIHDRVHKRITLSNQTVLYYQHLIFFSSLVVEGEVRAPDLSLGTLQAFAAALKYHSMRPALWNDPPPPAPSSFISPFTFFTFYCYTDTRFQQSSLTCFLSRSIFSPASDSFHCPL